MPVLPKQLREPASGRDRDATGRRRSRAGSFAGNASRISRPASASGAAAATVSSRLRAASTVARASHRLESVMGAALLTRQRAASAGGSQAPSRRASSAGAAQDMSAWGDVAGDDDRWSAATRTPAGSECDAADAAGTESEESCEGEGDGAHAEHGCDLFLRLAAEADRRQVRLVDLFKEVRLPRPVCT